ncbi:hypothetical protein [Deinococcus pimensis]|uniref:hypothetical protein n=1 Tax=Deinococcus pimensis TaxID=309888 RepID=UPI00047F3BEC|nr:hypothetical protein [Deinococcus pimensis]
MTSPAAGHAGPWLLTAPLLVTSILAAATAVFLVAMILANLSEPIGAIIFGPVIAGALTWAVLCVGIAWALRYRDAGVLTTARVLGAVQMPGGLLVALFLSSAASDSARAVTVSLAALHVLLALVLLVASSTPGVRAWYRDAAARDA